MPLPSFTNTNLKTLLNKKELVIETIEQIKKDFGMFGIEISFKGNIENAYDDLHTQLVKQVKELLHKNSEHLLSVLYRIDASEKDIKQTEKELPGYNHEEIIAHCIIAREFKKILTRNYYKNKE